MSRNPLLRLAEALLLLLALAFTLSPPPSNEGPIALLPSFIFAVACFGGSRALRWRGHWLLWGVELLAFAAFAWTSNRLANLLLTL